jgi:hypothetical protein
MKRETTLPEWKPGYGMTAFDTARNYMGERIEGYVVYSKHRDSDLLTVTNYSGILADLEAAAEAAGKPESVEDHSFGHWAVGHVDQIILTPDAPDAVFEVAERALERLADYPVYDDSAYSDAEWNAAADYWNGLSPREKVREAMQERDRSHWLKNEPCWRFGRYDFHTLANLGTDLSEEVYEQVRTCATE